MVWCATDTAFLGSGPRRRGAWFEVTMQLNLIEGFDLAALGHNSAAMLHLVAESIKVAKSDIYHFVADPSVTDVPTEGLLSKAFAERRRALIQPERAMAYPDHGTPLGAATTHVGREVSTVAVASERSYSDSTTSFLVVDRFGNVVVSTPTLGSG